VLARDGSRSALWLVPLADSSIERAALASLDPTRALARIEFRDAPAERLGDGETGGMEQIYRIQQRAAVYLAFEQIGAADRVLEMAREYALGRYAFGRPIGSFQAIKHKLADMYVKNQLARSNAYFGAWALNANAPELPLAAAAARISASDALTHAAKENIQTHGGMGFTWEVDAHLYYRRAKQLALAAGSPALWKERLATELTRGVSAAQPTAQAA
jgi:alkylation response protein AidB-like acyl-CoA dehydrogenase